MTIRFEVSPSSHLLEQYFRLREMCFRRELGVTQFDGSENQHDRAGRLLLAVDGKDRVLAGSRIVGTLAGGPSSLPLEASEFDLLSLFPSLGLADKPCCHWGRLVIDPDYRSKEFNRQFLRKLIEVSKDMGYHYALMITDSNRSRYYRLLHSSLGYDYQIAQEEIAAAEQSFKGLEHFISCAVLRPENEIRYRSALPVPVAKPNPGMPPMQGGTASRGNPNRLAQVA